MRKFNKMKTSLVIALAFGCAVTHAVETNDNFTIQALPKL
jgi:hypothetical protein